MELMLYVCTDTSFVTCRTGKTSIIRKYTDNFDPCRPTQPTIALDVICHTIEVANEIVKLEVSGDYGTVPCFSLLGTVETSAYSETSIIHHSWESQFYGG